MVGSARAFDQNVKMGDAFKDRIIQFARVNWQGINEPGWSERAAAELDRCFRNGAQAEDRQGTGAFDRSGRQLHPGR